MTAEELKALQAKWYAEAVEGGAIALCALVGRTLGCDTGEYSGQKHQWSEGAVTVYVDDYGGYMTVHADGKRVCSTHPCDRLFVPGEWFEVVKTAAISARQKQEGDEHRREEKQRRELAARLGINPDAGA